MAEHRYMVGHTSRLVAVAVATCFCGCGLPDPPPLPPPDIAYPNPPPPPPPPPLVKEIVPPSHSTQVRIVLHPSFTVRCSYREATPASLGRKWGADADLRMLHGEQERLLRESAMLRAGARIVMANMASECQRALRALGADREFVWKRISASAFKRITLKVLTAAQYSKYQSLSSQGRRTTEIFRWLNITNSQKRSMLAIYTDALQESQRAWAASAELATTTHAAADDCLSKADRFLRRASAVRVAFSDASSAVQNTDREFRDAQRELRWLETRLQVEDDLKKQILIRKQIADKRADADLRRASLIKKRQAMASYTWRNEELASACDSIARERTALLKAHGSYVSCLQVLSSLRGRPSDQCAWQYMKLRRGLQQSATDARHPR